MAATHRQSVNLSPPQAAWLAQQAQKLGISVADLIRRIIDQHRETKT